MSLYWCVFDRDRELDGIDAGSYEDFGALRDWVVERLEGGRAGSRFPTLVLRADCEGEWSAVDCERLEGELRAVEEALAAEPPFPLDGWKRAAAEAAGLQPRNACECFIDPDGRPLLPGLRRLAALARRAGLPILFQ